MSDAIAVLFIDDDPADRALVKRALETHPTAFAVTEKETKDDVVAALESSRYDVAVVDYKLKSGSGLTMIDVIQSQQLHIPVIMLTGTGTEETAITAMRQGVADYVIKRMTNIQRLPYTIEHVVARANAERAIRESQSEIERTHAW